MNVFYLSEDPKTCAELHCDKHVVKMCIEYAQILSTAHRVLDGQEYTDLSANGRKIKRWRLAEHDDLIYKAAHVNHPSSVWGRANNETYIWLYEMWSHLCDEYTYRYNKQHECDRKLRNVLNNPPQNIPSGRFYEPPPAMKKYPQCIVAGDSIASYQRYYRDAKAYFARWTKREIPDFMQVA